MKSISKKSLTKATMQLLLVTATVCSLAVLCMDATPAAGQGNSDDKALVGTWELYVATAGAANNQTPTIIVLQLSGNKLTGKVTVPIVDPDATGIKTTGSKDLTLENLNFNGRKLSFRVDEEGNELDADLAKVNDDEFEGRWRSRIQGRWKGSKSEFEGTLKMKRKR
jgi:hypothetical protein